MELKHYRHYCEDIENVENFEKAKADNFKGWDCHHRLETHNSDGERIEVNISRKELIALDMYYNRPAEEFVKTTQLSYYMENFINDCSDNCIIKTQKYFLDKGFIVKSIEKIEGIDNKYYGDLKVELFKDGIDKTVYIDYKKQTRDRDFIQIELVQVGVKGDFSSWLYNNNINYCIYEFKNGDVYLFEHYELIKIAKQNNTEDIWETCIVYNKNSEKYRDERNYIDEKLNSYRTIKDNSFIKADHINGCFNYRYDGTKTHSGFCINISLEAAQNYLI